MVYTYIIMLDGAGLGNIGSSTLPMLGYQWRSWLDFDVYLYTFLILDPFPSLYPYVLGGLFNHCYWYLLINIVAQLFNG